MKTFLLSLVLLFYLVPCSQGDCVAECLTCHKFFYQRQHFNALVCILQCKGKDISSVVWEDCRKITSASSMGVSRSQTRSLSFGNTESNSRVNSANTWGFLQTMKTMWPNDSGKHVYDDGAETTFEMDNSHRDTEKKHQIREVAEGNRSFQKRYGGFMGVRKSVRNWSNLNRQTNQKRYSKFLRQYLGLTTHSTE
ncbi:prepronociceptin b [Hemiscyllium ocellatum]|uniref:prepronociceptin b n=1 Tax=Hemiscyllium ocellatum TaxID=170820 RepID=UPI0029663627|nr:prepronociceptin b [Hemiscyllium ocellatum]